MEVNPRCSRYESDGVTVMLLELPGRRVGDKLDKEHYQRSSVEASVVNYILHEHQVTVC